MARASVVRKVGFGCLGLLALLVLLVFVTPQGNALRDLWGKGVIQAALEGDEKVKYQASTEANLKAIYNALKLYQDSEGQFPEASGWMDAIENRLNPSNMAKEEAMKKLISPALAGKAGEYGYAMNDAASGKYVGDLDPKMPLVFDSSDTARNAHGKPDQILPKPPRNGQNMGVAVDGTLLKL